MNVVQIVPFLPPKFCGIGDYSRLLAGAMESHGVKTHFIVADPKWRGHDNLDGFPVKGLSEQSEQALHEALEHFGVPNVLLHYVGYGYDDFGCPQWLLDALKQWRTKSSQRKLSTMFHEHYASGAFWTRAFWSSSRQKKLATGLSEASDHCRTNMSIVARKIEKLSSRHAKGVKVAPVFSTVGELKELGLFSSRKPQMVVFGSTQWRRRVYLQHRDELIESCRILGIAEIVDIGVPFEDDIELPLPLKRTGALPSSQISAILRDSQAGFLAYPTACFGKSTIFAAYCSHQLCVVSAGEEAGNDDGVQPNTHYWPTLHQKYLGAGEPEIMAQAAHSWYEQHNLENQALSFANDICI